MVVNSRTSLLAMILLTNWPRSVKDKADALVGALADAFDVTIFVVDDVDVVVDTTLAGGVFFVEGFFAVVDEVAMVVEACVRRVVEAIAAAVLEDVVAPLVVERIESRFPRGFTTWTLPAVGGVLAMSVSDEGYRYCLRSSGIKFSHCSMPAKLFWKKSFLATTKTLFWPFAPA